MNRSFIITEEDRKRILGLHQNATKNQYLKIISEQTEPVLPDDVTIEADLNGDFKIVPCVTKKGWLRGIDSDDNIYYSPKGSKYLYYGDGNGDGKTPLYLQTGNTQSDSKFLRNYTCNQRPFTPPAQTEEEITSGKKNLQIFDNSPMVTTLIQLLKKSQQLPDTKEEGTKFDKEVKDAVIKFQTVNNLKKDGIVGKNTWKRLSEVSAGSVNSGNFEKSAENVFNKTLPKFDSNIGNEPSAEQIANVKAMKGFDNSNLNQAGAEDKGTSKNMSEW